MSNLTFEARKPTAAGLWKAFTTLATVLDPMFWIIRIVLRGFYAVGLEQEELDFVSDNVTKHRKVLWINVVGGYLVYQCLLGTSVENIPTVIASLLAPVMVMGGAWFAISFGGIPAKLLDMAMAITFWMFTAFTLSLSAMFLAVGFVTNPYLWPVLALVYMGAVFSCMQYDTADGLKAGLDEAVLAHSRAALTYYQKQGIKPEEESAS